MRSNFSKVDQTRMHVRNRLSLNPGLIRLHGLPGQRDRVSRLRDPALKELLLAAGHKVDTANSGAGAPGR